MGYLTILLMAFLVSVALNIKFILTLRGHKGENR